MRARIRPARFPGCSPTNLWIIWIRSHSDSHVCERDLGKNPVPGIDQHCLAATTAQPGSEMKDAKRRALALSDDLIGELMAADFYGIYRSDRPCQPNGVIRAQRKPRPLERGKKPWFFRGASGTTHPPAGDRNGIFMNRTFEKFLNLSE